MISDRSLIKISLVVSAIGFIVLYIFTAVETPIMPIGGLKSGDYASVGGIVSSYKESKGNIFFTLENSSTINVAMFSTDAESNPMVYKIKDGDTVTVTGKVQYYRNELEMIAKNISPG